MSVQNVLDPEDPKTWSFSISCSWVEQLDPALDDKALLALLKKKVVENCGEPFRSAFNWIPDDNTTTTLGRISHWVTIPWDNHGGRVTLAGDAAHPMTPCKSSNFSRDNSLMLTYEQIEGRDLITALLTPQISSQHW
jgi:hypothetical protein